MIFIARPLSVYLALLPSPKMPKKDKVYVSWVGLRGAVPIIFAIYPLAADIPHSNFIFNIVFFCTLVSLVVQGTTLTSLAGLLGLIDKPKRNKRLKNFDIDFSDEIKSITSERVTPCYNSRADNQHSYDIYCQAVKCISCAFTISKNA